MIMRKVYYILLCCVWLGQVACQDKGTEVGGQGRIRLSITDRVISKALPDALSPELTDRLTSSLQKPLFYNYLINRIL